MPNDTLAANAAPMPTVDRRHALGSLAAAGALLAVPCLAKAAGDDADVFAVIERVKALHAAEKAAGARLSALEKLLPSRDLFPALRVRQGDRSIFDTDAPEGATMDRETVRKAQAAVGVVKALVRDVYDHPIYGTVRARVQEAVEADQAWDKFNDAEGERLGIDAAQEAFDTAASETYEAAQTLFDLRPTTLGGLRAVVETLLAVGVFETAGDDAKAFAELVVECPALKAEA